MEPRIIIIGAGPSGIAAATELIQNGFKNVSILEAEDRIGGRVWTTKLGECNVDLGGQWVHGEGENAVFKLAYPLGLLDKDKNPSSGMPRPKYVDSQGKFLEENVEKNLTEFYEKFIVQPKLQPDSSYKSFGEYAEKIYDLQYGGNPEFMQEKKKYLRLFELHKLGGECVPNWYHIAISLNSNFKHYEGDFLISWKERGYSTILDILLKRYPDPQKEIPVLEKTLLNTEVTCIDYSNKTHGEPVLITSADGQLFKADHVIVTIPLGILKEKHKSLFLPSLPDKKVEAVESIGYGNAGKIFLLFDKPFWQLGNESMLNFNFLWSDDDKTRIETDPEKSWTLGIVYSLTVKHNPNLLEYWICGKYAKAMEELPEDKVFNHIVEHLHRFFGKKYNLTTPLGMLRTRWYSNPHFRGTFCYPSSQTTSTSADLLEEPINVDKLTLLFAGEATSAGRYSTVDGAIESGWKAAGRLIKHYGRTV